MKTPHLARSISLACLVCSCMAGCVTTNGPPFLVQDHHFDRFSFARSDSRVEHGDCPDLHGMYQLRGTVHEVHGKPDGRLVRETRAESFRLSAWPVSWHRLSKDTPGRHFGVRASTQDQQAAIPDVFWVVQEGARAFEIQYWNALPPDGRRDGWIAYSRFEADAADFVCKDGYIHINGGRPSHGGGEGVGGKLIIANKMTLSSEGSLLYFWHQETTSTLLFGIVRSVDIENSMYEYRRVE